MTRPVIHDNDGHVDDLLSTLLLWLAPQIDLQAITLTDGDCYVEPAYDALVKMATFIGAEGAEIGYSEDPMPNPFPENWRRESYIVNELPIFSDNALKKPYQAGRPRKSQALISDILSHSREPVTIVATGPLTNLAPVFEARPELKSKVAEMYVMGGAFKVAGNVEQPDHDGSAEWNFYADPTAAKSVLDTGIPLWLVPLDVTNSVPVTKEFLQKLEEQGERYRASQLAAKIYSLVKGLNYYFWDTLTAAAAIRPQLFKFKEMRIDIVTSGKSQGRSTTTFFGGRKAQVAVDMDKPKFEELVLEVLRK